MTAERIKGKVALHCDLKGCMAEWPEDLRVREIP